MKVTLINPKGETEGSLEVHLSLLYLATALHRKGHAVRVIDSQVEAPEKSTDDIAKSDMVGFSVMTTQVPHALRLSDKLKSMNGRLPIVWGGVHPTLFPVQTVADKSVDYAIRGEGEHTMLELMDHLKRNKPVDKIRGLAYKKQKKPMVNDDRPYLDLNELSPPEWDLVNFGQYAHDFIIGKDSYGKSLPVHSGRGCVFRCSFCINTVMRQKWRPIDSKKIFNEVRELKRKYGIRYVKFVDENFFMRKDRVLEFCKLMIKNRMDVRWHATTRAEYMTPGYFNSEEMKLLKEAGFAVASMGIESGSPRVLEIIRKGITVEQVMAAVENCAKHGIKPICSFMIGVPGEREEDIFKTIRLIRKIKKAAPNALIIGPQVFRPYPGAELYNKIKGAFNEPKSLREWASTDMFSGYTSASHLPWVKDKELVESISFYVNRAQTPGSSVMKKLINAPFKLIAGFRLNHGLFGLTIDKKLYNFIERFYYRTK